MNNLDEDIKILKELAEDTIRYKMVETDAYMAGAITRVLSELETYKKIAEKLASVLSKKGIVYFEPVEPYKERTPIKKVVINGKEEIIDWARKEVEND